MVGGGLAVHRQDDVPQDVAVAGPSDPLQARPVGGAAVAHLQHDDALRRVEVGTVGFRQRIEARVGPGGPSPRDELGHDPVHGVHRHGEPDAGAAARGALDGRVHADEPSRSVEQRAVRSPRLH